MITINATSSFDFVRQALLGYERQIPFAMSRAINMTADDIKAAESEEMKRVFDRPKPWTLGGIKINYANKSNLSATVKIKDDEVAGGVPAAKYLAPEIFGGYRRVKRFEKALREAGIVPVGFQVVPAEGVRLDQYGNITRSTISQILSSLGARNAKRSKKTYFIVNHYNDFLEPGIYQRVGKQHVKPIMLFVKHSRYKPKFDFFGVAEHVANTVMLQNAQKAVRQAIDTAR
jgi:hypothetical protein